MARRGSCPLEIENQRTMSRLQPDRLKSSRTGSQTENSSQTTRKPRVVGTSDGLDLSAEPTYDREYNALLSLEEAVRQ